MKIRTKDICKKDGRGGLTPKMKAGIQKQFNDLKYVEKQMLAAKKELNFRIDSNNITNEPISISSMSEYATYIGWKEIFKKLAKERNTIKHFLRMLDRSNGAVSHD